MGNYKIVEASRTAEEPVFNENNSFRMKEATKKDSSNKENHYFGASSEQVKKDINRTTFLVSNKELGMYEAQMAKLSGRNYVQGDLNAASDLVSVVMNLMTKNIENGIDPQISKPIDVSCTYLRKDGAIGGFIMAWDHAANNVFLAVVNYPTNATSYNDGNVKYFFPENLADEVLDQDARTTSASEIDMLTKLKKTLNHDDISELVETIIAQKELLLSSDDKSALRRNIAMTEMNTTDTSGKTTKATFSTVDIDSVKKNIRFDQLAEYKQQLQQFTDNLQSRPTDEAQLVAQGEKVLSQIKAIAGNEPEKLSSRSICDLTKVLCSANKGLTEANDVQKTKRNTKELAALSQHVSGKASAGWKTLGICLLTFACAALVVVGVLAAIPSGGSSLLLTAIGATGLGLTTAAGVGAVVLAAAGVAGVCASYHGRETGLAKSTSGFKKALSDMQGSPKEDKDTSDEPGAAL